MIEKIYRNDQNCYVLIGSVEQAENFDKQLWTFRAGSFVPHQIYTGIVPELEQIILIGGSDIPEIRQNLIVNLSDTIPPFSQQTERILEILDDSDSCKQAGRIRYRHYQELGLTINTYKI